MAVYNLHTIIFSIILILIFQKTTCGLKLRQPNVSIAELGNSNPNEGIQRTDSGSNITGQNEHSRVKRQFGFGPYPYYGLGYYRRPIPIIVGGFGIGGPVSGGGFGAFGPRGFGGRGFGGRGFGGRGFGGRGFGGRGFGGRGFGGRGIGGRGGFGGRGGRG